MQKCMLLVSNSCYDHSIFCTIRQTFVLCVSSPVYHTLLCSIFCSVFCSWVGFVVLKHDQCCSHCDKSNCNFGSYWPLLGG